MLSRFAAFVIWGALAASGVFWAARLFATPMPVPTHATVVSTATAAKGDLTRLFGKAVVAQPQANSPGAAAPADARFQLLGVVAPRSAAARGEGLAVIAFDGKPARAYRVGAAVDGELVLLDVRARGVSLGAAGQAPQVNLELPLLASRPMGNLPLSNAAPQAQNSSVPVPSPSFQLPVPVPAMPNQPPAASPGTVPAPLSPGQRRNNPV